MCVDERKQEKKKIFKQKESEIWWVRKNRIIKKVVNKVGLGSVLQPNYEAIVQAYFKFAFALKKLISILIKIIMF